MNTITVKKERLLETLQTNRANHRDEFLKAQEGYRAKVIEVLDQRLQDAREGKQIDLRIHLPEPRDYTSDFDTAISMVEWAEGDTMDLEQHDFERYVLNKWEWREAFIATNSRYAAAG